MLQKCGKLANVGNNFQLKSNGSFLILVILSLCDNMCSSKFNPHFFLGLRGPLKAPLFPSRLQPFHLLILFLPPSTTSIKSRNIFPSSYKSRIQLVGLSSLIWELFLTNVYIAVFQYSWLCLMFTHNNGFNSVSLNTEKLQIVFWFCSHTLLCFLWVLQCRPGCVLAEGKQIHLRGNDGWKRGQDPGVSL